MAQDDDRRSETPGITHERIPAKSIRMDCSPLRQRTLKEYHRACEGLVDVKQFGATEESTKNFVLHSCNCLEHEEGLGSWMLR